MGRVGLQQQISGLLDLFANGVRSFVLFGAGGMLLQRIITVLVFGCLPTASGLQNHASGVQKLVGSVIIPSLLLHTYLPLALGLTGTPVTLKQDLMVM